MICQNSQFNHQNPETMDRKEMLIASVQKAEFSKGSKKQRLYYIHQKLDCAESNSITILSKKKLMFYFLDVISKKIDTTHILKETDVLLAREAFTQFISSETDVLLKRGAFTQLISSETDVLLGHEALTQLISSETDVLLGCEAFAL